MNTKLHTSKCGLLSETSSTIGIVRPQANLPLGAKSGIEDWFKSICPVCVLDMIASWGLFATSGISVSHPGATVYAVASAAQWM